LNIGQSQHAWFQQTLKKLRLPPGVVSVGSALFYSSRFYQMNRRVNAMHESQQNGKSCIYLYDLTVFCDCPSHVMIL
jgi:hypothetical protein